MNKENVFKHATKCEIEAEDNNHNEAKKTTEFKVENSYFNEHVLPFLSAKNINIEHLIERSPTQTKKSRYHAVFDPTTNEKMPKVERKLNFGNSASKELNQVRKSFSEPMEV